MNICHVYDSVYVDPADSQGEEHGLHLWCLDRQSIPMHLVIKKAPIYCYIELPSSSSGISFDENSMKLFHKNLQKVHGKCAPIYVDYMERQKLYYYRGKKKTPMAALFFKTKREMNICAYRLMKSNEYPDFGMLNFRIFEKDISVRRKVFTFQKTRYAQWFSFRGTEIPYGHSSRMAKRGASGREIREFMLDDYTSISPISSEESMGWTAQPRVFSFDIETYTDNHYSIPDKTNPDHVIYLISGLFQVTGDKESRKKFILTTENCDPIENTEIIKTDDEEQLIVEFQKLIDRLDPEIMMGYNIFGYDYPYIDARHEMQRPSWEPCSRLEGFLPSMYINTWTSSSYGKNIISYLQMPGRISIDLLPLIRRDYKLDKYSLDFVSQSLLGVGKHDVSPIEMFKTFESKNVEAMTKVARYCVQDADLVLDLYEKMNVWVGLVEMASIVGVEIMELFTRGQQIRCVSQIYDLTARNKIVLDSRESEHVNYEGGFVGDPIKGLHDNVICLDFASLYPSIMRAYNICYTTLIPPIHYDQFDESECHTIKIDDTISYRFVREELCKGILPQLVENLVNERKNVRKEIEMLEKTNTEILSDKEKRQHQLTLAVLDKRQNGLKVSANSMYGFLGVQEGGKLPLIEGAISITARGRQLITEVNDFLRLKYNATIVYNDTDSSMVTIPEIKNSSECHFWGNKLADEISGKPAKLDSDGKTILCPEIKGLFPPPLKMEFEKAVRFLGIAKKKYAAFLIQKDGTFEKTREGDEKILKRGIVIARRDNFGYLRKKYTEVLYSILRKNPIKTTFKIIVDAVFELFSGKLEVRGNLTIIKGLGREYKSESYFMKIFQDELSKMGHPVQAGDRLEYIIVENSAEPALGKKMRLIEMYEDSQKFVGKTRPFDVYPLENIDYMYYISNGLQNPLDQLFSIGYIDLFQTTTLGEAGFIPKNSAAHPILLSSPIKMIMTMIRDNLKAGHSKEECLEYLETNIFEWFSDHNIKRKFKNNLLINFTANSDEDEENEIGDEMDAEEFLTDR